MNLTQERKLLYILLVFFPVLLFLIPSLQGKVLFWGTSSLQFIPWRSLALESLVSGELPFWNPYNGLGTPLLANYQLAFFYPPNWLQLPFYLGWGVKGVSFSYNLLVPLHLIWAAIGMSFFTKELKCSTFGQGIAAVSFSLCTYLISRISFFSIIWTVSWLPWLFFTSTKWVQSLSFQSRPDKKSWKYLLWFIGTIAMLLLAGHAQTAWYSLLITGGWCLVLGLSRGRWKGGILSFTGFLSAALFAALIAAVQLVPTFEFLFNSQRAASVDFEVAMRYSFWPWRLLTFFLPDFFGNPGNGTFWGYGNYWEDACYVSVIALFFAFMAIIGALKSKPDDSGRKFAVFYFLPICFLAIFLALGNNTPLYKFLYQDIPTFKMFQAPSRWIIISCFSLAVLAGIGADEWDARSGGSSSKKIILALVILVGVIFAGTFTVIFLPQLPRTMPISIIRFGVTGIVFAFLLDRASKQKRKGKSTLFLAAIIVFCGLDLFITGYGLNPFTNISLYSGAQKASAAPLSDPRTFLSSRDEYDQKFSRFFRTHDFRPIEEWDHLRLVNLPNINILNKTSYVNNFDPMLPAAYSRLLDALESTEGRMFTQWLNHLNVDKRQLLDINSPAGINYLQIADSQYIHTYTCKTNKPLNTNPITISSSIQLEPDSPIFVDSESREAGSQCIPGSYFDLKDSSGSMNSLEIHYSSENDVWVELSTIWYPGWDAYLDGKPLEVYKVNGLFLGLKVPPGQHSLSINYKPDSFRYGSAITLLAFLALAVIWILSRVKKNP